jgi:hypothetical protein
MSSPCSAVVSTRRERISVSIRDVIGTRNPRKICQKISISGIFEAFQIFENILEENAQHNVWKAKTMPDEGQLEPT